MNIVIKVVTALPDWPSHQKSAVEEIHVAVHALERVCENALIHFKKTLLQALFWCIHYPKN